MYFTAFNSYELRTRPEPWLAPTTANDKKNPLKENVSATIEGGKLYLKYCTSCHGSKGKGNGIGSSGLQTKPADHTSNKVQNQSDGAIFWKISEGRKPMPPYKAALTELQIWQLVNFIRTLAKPIKNKM